MQKHTRKATYFYPGTEKYQKLSMYYPHGALFLEKTTVAQLVTKLSDFCGTSVLRYRIHNPPQDAVLSHFFS
jgi:hypothetical protein